ncbi:signal recognition particle-docking protein FtsY [Kingella oralis]|uniref:signal recognition particle-docking protein FtsY n=1 Tax=Kingella oralis TaxID=505 RepID=UPI0034E592B9
MLGFFNKLFKSKTPAPETQTQPENEQNNTPTAAENVPAAPTQAAEPNTSDTQPENTAAETAEQTAEPVAAQATEHSAQPEASANESASVETAEPEPAAQAQPENAEPSPAAPENETDGTTANAAAEKVAQGQPENPVTQPETEANHPTESTQSPTQPESKPDALQPNPNEPPVRNWTMAAVVDKPNSWAGAAEPTQPETASAPSETQPETVASESAAAETAPVRQPETHETEPETKPGWASRLKQGLTKSRNHMAKSLAGVFGGGQIDEDLYEELETVLLTSDMGIEATEQLMREVRDRVSLKGLKDGNELRQALKDAVYDLLKPLEQPLAIPENGAPFVIMLAGINGAGKTTSIGKLAKYFQAQGKSVILAAGDTFRAAAREQLQEWGERNGVTVISQAKGDSAAVCFDAVEAAKARQIDIVLADTAGRLPTQLHLMEEIKKVKRVLQKSLPDAPHEIIVVLDANIGQNAVNQVVAFDDALGVTGLIVTKLDGTAKGGVLAALASSRAIPVRYIGVGESIDDLRPFNAKDFVDALLD